MQIEQEHIIRITVTGSRDEYEDVLKYLRKTYPDYELRSYIPTSGNTFRMVIHVPAKDDKP